MTGVTTRFIVGAAVAAAIAIPLASLSAANAVVMLATGVAALLAVVFLQQAKADLQAEQRRYSPVYARIGRVHRPVRTIED